MTIFLFKNRFCLAGLSAVLLLLSPASVACGVAEIKHAVGAGLAVGIPVAVVMAIVPVPLVGQVSAVMGGGVVAAIVATATLVNLCSVPDLQSQIDEIGR